MAGYKLSHFKKIIDQLGPGETFVAGAAAMPPGGMRRHAATAGVGGALGALVAGGGQRGAGDVQLPGKFVLGLTNERLLFCKPDNVWGHPKAVLYAIPLAEIASAEPVKTGAISKQAKFMLTNGQEIVVESQRAIAGKWMDDLLEQIQPLLGH